MTTPDDRAPMTVAPLRSPEEIVTRSLAPTPTAFAAEPDVFAQRAQRLAERAAGHPMRAFLRFAATLAMAQQAVANGLHAPIDASTQASWRERRDAQPGLPVLAPDAGGRAAWPRPWQPALDAVLDAFLAASRPGMPDHAPEALAVAQRVRGADAAWRDEQALKLRQGISSGLDRAAAPFLAAGLQVAAHRDARALVEAPLDAARFIDDATHCPCCGGAPLASVVRVDAEGAKARRLVCAICSTEWPMVRIKCAHCLSTAGIGYQELAAHDAGAPVAAPGSSEPGAAVQAETCDTCRHYLKIVYQTRDLGAEPCADDLATLPLDLLVDAAGYVRHGFNPWLVLGEDDAEAAVSSAAAATDARTP